MKLLDLAQDIRSAKLIKCCQGVASAGLLEASEAKVLIGHARAVRMLLEAGDLVLVRETLDRLVEALAEIDHALVSTAVKKHVAMLQRVV